MSALCPKCHYSWSEHDWYQNDCHCVGGGRLLEMSAEDNAREDAFDEATEARDSE